jgi:hypothetical protein
LLKKRKHHEREAEAEESAPKQDGKQKRMALYE